MRRIEGRLGGSRSDFGSVVSGAVITVTDGLIGGTGAITRGRPVARR